MTKILSETFLNAMDNERVTDSSVGTATVYGMYDSGSIPGRDKIFLFSTEYRLALEPIQPHTGRSFPGDKRQGLTTHHQPVTMSRMVELYLHSSKCLHGIGLK
jgi:hypothetical protein